MEEELTNVGCPGLGGYIDTIDDTVEFFIYWHSSLDNVEIVIGKDWVAKDNGETRDRRESSKEELGTEHRKREFVSRYWQWEEGFLEYFKSTPRLAFMS